MDNVKTTVVAGAGSGIGSALLEKLHQNNHYSLGFSRRGIELEKLLRSGINYKCDFRNEDSIKSAFNNLEKIDSLFITMGDGIFKPFSEIGLQEWEEHIRLNLTAPFLTLKHAYPYLLRSNNPLVVILSSTAGKMGFPESSAYCTTKHGIAGLAKAIREEWKPRIRVTLIYPGAVYTPIWDGRTGFSKEDMIPESDFAQQLVSILDSPPTLNMDEMYILPRKGILTPDA